MRTSTFSFVFISMALIACGNDREGAAESSNEADLSGPSGSGPTGTRIQALAKSGLAEDLKSALSGANGVPGVLEIAPNISGGDEAVSLDLLGSRSFLLTDASDGSGPELIFPAYRDDQVDDGHAHAMKVFAAMTRATEKVTSIPKPTETLEYITRTSASGRIICASDGTVGGAHRFHCIIRGITQLEQNLTDE